MLLVTGGAGYIGGIVAERLLQQGRDVCVFDNLSRGYRDAVPGQATFVRGDIGDRGDLRQVFARYPIESVMHFAAFAMVGESSRDPGLYYDNNVAKALAIVMDGGGIALSKRRITLSTAGVVPMIRRCGDEIGVKLAVSLHAPDDALRDRLVPINRKYPLAELMAACRDYPGAHNARRITFEYVMLDGVNDSPGHARALARLVAGIPAKFNLIPFNPWPGAPYHCSPVAAIERFSAILNDAGYTATARTPRGHDIMAACGQLRTDSLHARAPLRESAAGGG